MNQRHSPPSPNLCFRPASALLAVLAGLLVSGPGSQAFADGCNCGADNVEVRGDPGGAVTSIKFTSGTEIPNPITPIKVDLVHNKSVTIAITATWTQNYGCDQAYITFPGCGIEYRTHARGAGDNVWGEWTKGNRFELGITTQGSAGPNPDKFQLRITPAASDTANDPTGAGAGAGTGAGSVNTSNPKMEYHAATHGSSVVAPGVSASIPMGPVGTGPNGMAPFRSAGTLETRGAVSPGLAAPGGFECNSIDEVAEHVTEVPKVVGEVTEERHFFTPTKAFRLCGLSAGQPVSIQGATGTLVEEYAPNQYNASTHEFTGDARAVWKVEPVTSGNSGPEGIRFTRVINGITTTETALANTTGSTLVTEVNGTTTTIQIVPVSAAEYTETVTRQTDGVGMASETRTYTHMSWDYEMTERIVDPDPTPNVNGNELVYAYGYYDCVGEDGEITDPVSHRRIRYRTEPNGNWALYSYSGSHTCVKSPFCSETVPNQNFTGVVSAGQGSAGRYILTSDGVPLQESVYSSETSSELWQVGGNSALAILSSGESHVDISDPNVRVNTNSVERTGSDVLSSTSVTYAPELGGDDAWLAGKPILSADSSGRATLHVWIRDTDEGTITDTETEGLADATADGGVAVNEEIYFHVVPSASSRTITTTGADGVLEREVQYHTGNGFSTAYVEVYSYDDDGRLTDVSISNRSIRHYQYPSVSVTVSSEAGAGITRTQMDNRGRTVSRTTAAPNGSPIATTWTYSGLTTTTRVNGTVEETTVTDTLGRIVSRTDRTGATTTTGYTGGGSEVTDCLLYTSPSPRD